MLVWAQAFDESYASRYGHRSDSAAIEELAGLMPRLEQAPGPILDACCGNGRHLQAMRDAGLKAWGFDWSLPLLRLARKRDLLGLGSRIARGDMRAVPFCGAWGAITMLFTAFGYFDDAQNAQTFAGVAAALAPKGGMCSILPMLSWYETIWFLLQNASCQMEWSFRNAVGLKELMSASEVNGWKMARIVMPDERVRLV